MTISWPEVLGLLGAIIGFWFGVKLLRFLHREQQENTFSISAAPGSKRPMGIYWRHGMVQGGKPGDVTPQVTRSDHHIRSLW